MVLSLPLQSGQFRSEHVKADKSEHDNSRNYDAQNETSSYKYIKFIKSV
jgi:hypothetical protein